MVQQSQVPAPGPEIEYRYRVRYEKRGKMKFLSHLDLGRAIIRSLRRAGVPLAYSKGFSPKPRISFGPALPLGIESSAEYFDLHTTSYLEEERFLREAGPFFPEGLSVTKLKTIPRKAPSLSEALNLALYTVRLEEPLEGSPLWDWLEGWEKIKERGSGGTEEPDRLAEMARSVKKLDYEKGKWIRFLIYLSGENKVRIGDILTLFLGKEKALWNVEREDVFMEQEGRLYSPFLAAKVNG